jgi:ATPase subunit of ABC transporter with duplicated ATPase domains
MLIVLINTSQDALMEALKIWHGGVILISHDERFINNVCKQLWVCADGTLSKWWVAFVFRGLAVRGHTHTDDTSLV